MKKILSFLLLAVSVSASSFGQKSVKAFQIMGTLNGFADSTILYLDDTDSAMVTNNQFHFKGTLKKNVKQVLLRTKNYSDYKFFWLENSAIAFKAEKGKFREAVIIGSKTQDEQNILDAAIKSDGNEKEQCISFIRNHPHSIISASILSIYASTWGRDTAKALYRMLSGPVKSTEYGKNILKFITLNKNIKVGDKYVDFTETNPEGKKVSLSDFKGKVVLLEFWGSWCGPCREGHPELVRIYNEFKDDGFNILGVAADLKEEDWKDAIRKDSLAWPNICDLKGDKNKAALIYGISYYPANFLIDRTGTIIAKDLRGADLRNKLREILK